jgi:ABC-2 type transport system ATP-binding protein
MPAGAGGRKAWRMDGKGGIVGGTEPIRFAGGGMPAVPMIDVEGLTKQFGPTRALDQVSLSAQAGRVLALLGPNGAGKTTLVRVLTTLLMPDGGRARVAGLDVTRSPQAIRSMIGLAGQYASVDELLTGRENLELAGLLYHLDRPVYRRRAQEALERMSLTEAGDRTVRTYSGGMRRRLDLAASLIGRPPVLFLDEPTTGLDPRTRNELWQLVEELVADGTTVLLTTQYMVEAEHLASRIVVLDAGRVVAMARPTSSRTVSAETSWKSRSPTRPTSAAPPLSSPASAAPRPGSSRS